MEKTKEPSTRQQALSWWNNELVDFGCGTQLGRNGLCSKYFGSERYFTSLTGREIEEIWNYEMQRKEFILEDILFGGENSNYKLNQKQFKQFDESLFRNYIDKFSDEDKRKALKILVCEISTTDVKFNSLLNQISNYK